jgi:hypothetical protein
LGFLTLVWIVIIYISVFIFIRVGKRKEKTDAGIEELKLELEKIK